MVKQSGCPETSVKNTNPLWVKYQMSEDLFYTEVEGRSHAHERRVMKTIACVNAVTEIGRGGTCRVVSLWMFIILPLDW